MMGDRLSSMPNDVISHILSLMPTKYAVRTSVLSKSWIHNWKSVTNLDFNDNHPFHDKHCFIKYVNRVLECCEASQVKVFKLRCLGFGGVDGSHVCEWIDAAVRLNVCELDIKAIYHVLPHSFFTCKTLTKLRLHSKDISDGGNGELYYPSYVNLPCLKTIDINVMYKASSVDVLNLIRGCPVLESLSLKLYIHSNKVYNFNNPSLKHLKLSIIKKPGIYGYKVVLNVPKLEDLHVRAYTSPVFVVEDLSSLISVRLSSYEGLNPLWEQVFKGVSGAKSLTLDVPRNPKTPSDTPIPNFPYLKHLEFNASFARCGMDWRLFHQMLENSPELEHLCIIMTSKSPYSDKDSCWIEPQSVPTCILNNLRTMKFANFKGHKSHLRFLAYLLRNAEALTMLTISTCDSLALEEEMQLSAEVSMLPRASRYCEIHFLRCQSHSLEEEMQLSAGSEEGNYYLNCVRTWLCGLFYMCGRVDWVD